MMNSADVMRSFPTSSVPSSSVHVPPNSSTSSCSAIIQYGSVSTRVPSMSHSTAAGRAFGVSVTRGSLG